MLSGGPALLARSRDFIGAVRGLQPIAFRSHRFGAASRRRVRACLGFIATALTASSSSAATIQAPLGYLTAHGPRAATILDLTYGTLAISCLVSVIIAGLLVWAILRRRPDRDRTDPKALAVARTGGGLPWIYVGVGLSTVALFGAAAWTMVVLRAVATPATTPTLTVEITGKQWWWEVRYLDEDHARTFTTANEIHIPVGVPVAFRLKSEDVIHSFWVPALHGKTDVIPGQTNTTWLQADRPGVYRGQCTEYCGKQHAHMGFVVVAESSEAFARWYQNQLAPAPPPAGDLAEAQKTFAAKCGACHAVRGSLVGGRLGPDLSHLKSRRTLAAGTLPNTPGHLGAWIADPQHFKPGAKMPRLDISGPELARVQTYLATLD